MSRLLFPFSLDVPFVLYRLFFCIAGVLCGVFGFVDYFLLAFGLWTRLFGFLSLGWYGFVELGYDLADLGRQLCYRHKIGAYILWSYDRS